MYTVSTGGCYAHHPAPYKMYRPNGISEYLLLFVRTKANFQVGENTFEVLPNQIVIVDKNTPYQYYVTDTPYIDDWMHFDCDEKDFPLFLDILKNDGLSRTAHTDRNCLNKPITLSNAARISAYIHQIIWESGYTSEEYSRENVNMLMQILMNHIREALRCSKSGVFYSPYYGKMQELRLHLQSNPDTDLSLEAVAKSMSISSSYFQHLYTKYFGVSFRNDIISMRIEYAKELLTGTTDSIETIAYLCGYNNEVHFYRQFRKNTGMTPTEYRNTSLL